MSSVWHHAVLAVFFLRWVISVACSGGNRKDRGERLNIKIFLQVIRKDLEDCEAHILALETLVSSNPTNGTKFERLYADWKLLYNAVRVRCFLAKVFFN